MRRQIRSTCGKIGAQGNTKPAPTIIGGRKTGENEEEGGTR